MAIPTAPLGQPPPTMTDALRYLWRLLWLVRDYWPRLAATTLVAVVTAGLGMAAPLLTKALYDEVYPTGNLDLLTIVVIGSATVGIVSAMISGVRNVYAQWVNGELSRAMSLLFFNHLQHQPMRFFDARRVGEITARFGDVQGSLSALTRVLSTVLVNGTYVVVVPPFLLAMNWRLALLAVAAIPITTVINLYAGRRLRPLLKLSAEGGADLNAMQVDSLANIRTLKLLGGERDLFHRLREQAHRLLELQLRSARLTGVASIGSALARAVGGAAFTWYAWSLIVEQRLTLGQFVVFTAYLGFFTGPLSQFASLFNELQHAAIALGRMFEYLDAAPEADPADVYAAAPRARGRIPGPVEFQDVNFEYVAGRPVLDGFSASFPAPGLTVLLGPSGAGKSTLIRLLCGLDQPTRGQILLNGTPISAISLRELRQQVSVVWQEVGLFRGTLWDNLTLGMEGADRAAVERAVDVCKLRETVEALPDGYASPVAEWGSSFSAGQRQRISLARALIRSAPIVALDEAMSNVDQQTERQILEGLRDLSTSCTVLLVTHRVSSAALGSAVCLINNGRNVALGTHSELLLSSEPYRQLHHDPQPVAANVPLRVISTGAA